MKIQAESLINESLIKKKCTGPFVRPLAPLTHLLSPYCLLCLRAPLRSFPCSLTRSRAYGKEVSLEWMRQFHTISTHSATSSFHGENPRSHELWSEQASEQNNERSALAKQAMRRKRKSEQCKRTSEWWGEWPSTVFVIQIPIQSLRARMANTSLN